jgi:L-ribulose-5-phosphate 3-epimerase
MRIGIMQGRLGPPEDGRFQSFPRERWREEFALAAVAGLQFIEWIYDAYGADANPIATDEGIAELHSLSARHEIATPSICADYFMDYPLVRVTPAELDRRLQTLEWLLERSQKLGAKHIVLPFVDASRITSDQELAEVVAALSRVLPAAKSRGVELHLETDLPPRRFAELLARLPDSTIKVNYDSGNSASLGYRPQEEFAAYGDRVGSVHIKDRVLGGGTVPLGRGDADLKSFFACLRACDYRGNYVLQVARAQPGDEVDWARKNRQRAMELWSEHA